jgi:hypothetical protein
MKNVSTTGSISYRKRSRRLHEMRKIDEGGIRFEISPIKAPVGLAQQTSERASSARNLTELMHLHPL